MKPARLIDRDGDKARRARFGGGAPALATPDMGAAFVNANANMEVRRAEGDRQIPIEHPDMGRRSRRLELKGRALDDWSESDFAPVVFEQIAQQCLERLCVRRQGEDVDGRTVDFDRPVRSILGFEF